MKFFESKSYKNARAQWRLIRGNRWLRLGGQLLLLASLLIISNLYLQWCQNDLSADLAFKFAFQWHSEKFFLSCLVLGLVLLLFIGLLGSIWLGSLWYATAIGLLGFANYQKMTYRLEPIYPDDLKMMTEWSLLKDMVGAPIFYGLLLLVIGLIGLTVWQIKRHFVQRWQRQVLRILSLCLALSGFWYVSHFNEESNLLRRAYNRTALWIPYSQKMNYYNTGFVAGFLYNLKVVPMVQPADYSETSIAEILAKYTDEVEQPVSAAETPPNIIFVMSESFSDPSHLTGLNLPSDTLATYRDLTKQTFSGQMLSQNYGGGTANIEFEALTGFSMALFSTQLTTPYTMLLPKMTNVPSVVSLLQAQGYATTALHPYNTSMYKRQDVYQVLGFDQFISEADMQHTQTIDNNPYIADQAAYQEILDMLNASETPQFIHLVTMQTHMPYTNKYTKNLAPQFTGLQADLANYLQDVTYASEALADFLAALQQLEQRTIVVFWGDHLPSIYSDEIKEQNEEVAMHLTEFSFFDSAGQLTSNEGVATLSPIYFAPMLFEQAQVGTSPFYQLLLELQEVLPAFEKGFYYQNGQWQKEALLNAEQQAVFDAYQLIQYDITTGNQYSLASDFFKESSQ